MLIVNCQQGHLIHTIWYLCIIDSVLLISLLRRLTLTRTLIHRWPARLWSLTTKEQRCFKYDDYMLMSLVLITNVKVTDVYYKYDGDEETLKGLVAEHGAVVTTYESHSWPNKTQNWSSNKYDIDIYNMYNNLPIFLISFCLQRKCKRRVHGLQGGSFLRLRTLDNLTIFIVRLHHWLHQQSIW